MSFQKSKFQIEGMEGKFSGIFNPQIRWNGWLCPLFPLDVAKKIIKSQDFDDCIKYEMSFYKICDYPKGITEHHLDGVEFLKVTTFEGIDYYPIGYMNWVWELA
jgi:hypothetical protein